MEERQARAPVHATWTLDYPGTVFSRHRSTADDAAEQPTAEAAPEPVTRSGAGHTAAGKGRPTPRRTQAQAARRRPLVPADRKAAAKSQRAAAKRARDREYQAMRTGDERYLPARDKGPVRRWVRDYVDARRNLGEYFLPISIIMLLSTVVTTQNPTVGVVVILALYLVVIATVVDAFWLSRVLKKKLNARFGEDKVPRGTLMYGVLRAFQMRRTRLPKPQVSRGEYPV